MCKNKLSTSKMSDFELEALDFWSEHGIPPLDLSKETSKHIQKREEDLAKKESYNNLAPPSLNQKNSKNLCDIASDLVNKFRSSLIFGDKFEEEFLQAHNEYRKNHGAKPLELSKKLCKLAEDWAKAIEKKGKPEHRNQNDYGENIFLACSTDPNFKVTGRDPVKKWYSEVDKHQFGKEPEDLKSRHFTQVVWEDTRELGVGVAKSKDDHIYVVAYYYPPGNVIGSFASKVKPPNPDVTETIFDLR